jgi:hypothetical protein
MATDTVLSAPAARADGDCNTLIPNNKRLNNGVVADVYTPQHEAGFTNRVKINPHDWRPTGMALTYRTERSMAISVRPRRCRPILTKRLKPKAIQIKHVRAPQITRSADR